MGHGQYAKAGANGRGMMPIAVNVQIPNIEQAASYHCPACMNNIFHEAVRIMEVSALLSPTVKAEPGVQKVYECSSCRLAWDLAHLKRLSAEERTALIETLKAQQAELLAKQQAANEAKDATEGKETNGYFEDKAAL